MNTYDLALNIRKDVVRMTHLAKSSHIGSMLSIADIIAVLYGKVLNKRADKPLWPLRDRFILSKGHAGAAVYAVLAELGYFPIKKLNEYCSNGSVFSGHISHDVPGVELSTGSLGHGLSVGVGMALAAKMDLKKHRVVVLLSDGECDEGSNWEAALFAAHHKLSNLIVLVDYNKIQSLGKVEEILQLEPFSDKWISFGWDVKEVDGHNHEELVDVLNFDISKKEKPTCIIAHTIKGKAVSFMENTVLWHYRTPQDEEYEKALEELGGGRDER